MEEIKKPTILLSKCIEIEPCRYDGAMIKNPFIIKLREYVNIITVCPEQAIGLPTPREALRLVYNGDRYSLLCSKSGEDLTESMESFSKEFIDKITMVKLNGVILKGRSPSCGIKDVKTYSAIGKSPQLPKKTSGIFAQKVMDNYRTIAIEDEGRLTNFNIREHFLTRVFASFYFNEVEEEKSVNSLIRFQSQYKYLLMAYSPSKQKELGKIVAVATRENIGESLDQYKELLYRALAVAPSTKRNVNMLLHLLGYFSKDLSKEEKAFFLDNLEKYQNKKIPFSVPLAVIKSWVIRFQNQYLLEQKIFEAFPSDLIEVTDSGKGI